MSTEMDVKSLVVGMAAGSMMTIALYKYFNEEPAALVRRLQRRGSRGAIAINVAQEKMKANRKPVRIWVDGCFDLMHMGHANAFRQARALGDVLVVGVNSDAEVRKVKGPPLMTEEERICAVSACKFVDEVVTDVPYVLNEEYLQMIFDKYKIDYIVHGDDPCLLPDGSDVFATAKAAGRYRTIKRTEGVSTTDVVGRMLLCSTEHHAPSGEAVSMQQMVQESPEDGEHDHEQPEYFTRHSHFLATARRINEFSSGKVPRKGDKIVYVDGAWDLFHPGHIDFLKAARALGDFLIVGVFGDREVNKRRGRNYPIMNVYERVLSVLACKYVDEVIIDAPWQLDRDAIVSMNISLVVQGTSADANPLAELEESYKEAKAMGMYRRIESSRHLTTEDIVRRVAKHRDEFEKKFANKHEKEEQYNANKEYVEEL